MLHFRGQKYYVFFGFLLLSWALVCPTAISAAERTEEDEKQESSTTSPSKPRSQPTGHSTRHVAVVDVARLEKQHTRLRAFIEDLKKQREANLAELQKDADKLARLEKQLQECEEGSEEHKELANKVALASAELTAKRLKFAEENERREAKIYYQFHGEVTREIKQFAHRYDINLVVPFDSSDLGPEATKEEILDRMTTNPLYEGRIDITDDILRRLNPPYPTRARGFPTPR